MLILHTKTLQIATNFANVNNKNCPISITDYHLITIYLTNHQVFSNLNHEYLTAF